MTRRLLCVGDLTFDVTITLDDDLAIGSDSPGSIDVYGGGSAANVAAWAAGDGIDVRFIGAVGDDRAGDLLTTELADVGVEVDAIRRPGERTATIAAVVGGDGNRSLVSDVRTRVALSRGDYRQTWLDDVDWLHLTAYTYVTMHSRDLFAHLTREAAGRGIPYSIDPSAAHLLAVHCDRAEVTTAFTGASVLFPSHDEAEYLTGISDPATAAVELLDLATTVAVTCGPDGAHLADRTHGCVHVPAHPARVVNTLGCGDAFVAGYLAAHLHGADLVRAGSNGARLAAKAAQIPAGR